MPILTLVKPVVKIEYVQFDGTNHQECLDFHDKLSYCKELNEILLVNEHSEYCYKRYEVLRKGFFICKRDEHYGIVSKLKDL